MKTAQYLNGISFKKNAKKKRIVCLLQISSNGVDRDVYT